MSLKKSLYSLRSRIRFARYNSRYHHKSINLFQQNPHPVTLGPENISRFFAFVANSERP
jgi:hypothetical protein